MDEESQVNDRLKIMKLSLMPRGLKHAQFFIFISEFPPEDAMVLKTLATVEIERKENVSK